MGRITFIPVTGCQPPALCTISFVSLRVVDAIGTVYQSMSLHLLLVIRITVFQSARVEPHIGIMGKEQRAAKISSQRQCYIIKLLAVPENDGVGPSFMIHRFRNGIGGRSSSKDISDVTLIMPLNLMVHCPTVIRRPVPVKHVFAIGEPVPFCLTPQSVDKTADVSFHRSIFVKVLVCSQQAFEHKGRFHQVGSIIFPAERDGLSCLPVHPVCPDAMITVRTLVTQKADNLQHTFRRLLAGDETTLRTDDNGHHSETRTTDSHNIITAITTFARQPRNRMPVIPEVTESLLLHQSHQFFIGQ